MSGRKKTQKQNTNSMKEELLKWICIKHATNSPLDRNILRDKADELVKHFQLTDFKCSESWLTVFLKRHGFSSTFTEQCGPILEDYQTWILMIRGLINQYRYEDQYHMDELSMYTDFIPSSKLKPDELPDDPVDMSSLKLQFTTPAMNKITLLLVCNASGTEKLKPIVCGPYSLNENEKYSYSHNDKSIITDEIIGAWLFSLNHEMSKCNRSILLFMSRKRINALKLVHLTHILPVFFPYNFPTELKPLRRDIFHYIKMFYRKLYIEKLCSPIASTNWQANDIANMLVEAWKQVPRDLIVSRFQRIKFREDDSFLTIECTEWDNLDTGVSFKRFVTFDDDLGESSGQICDDLRFLTRIKHQFNLKTLKNQDLSDQEAGTFSRCGESPKRPDDDFVDDGDSDCHNDESMDFTKSPSKRIKRETDSETILSSSAPNSGDVDAAKQDDDGVIGTRRNEAAEDFGGKTENLTTADKQSGDNGVHEDSNDSPRNTSTEDVDSSANTASPINFSKNKMETDDVSEIDDSFARQMDDPSTSDQNETGEIAPLEETSITAETDEISSENEVSSEINNEEEMIPSQIPESAANENTCEFSNISSSTEKIDDSINISVQNVQNFDSLSDSVTSENLIDEKIQFTSTVNYSKMDNNDKNCLSGEFSEKINEQSSIEINPSNSVDKKNIIDDLQSNVSNYESKIHDKLDLSLQAVDKIVDAVIKSSELHENVDKTEISMNSDNIECNSIDLSLEISEKIDDSSMDTLTNDSTNELQNNSQNIDDKKNSEVYQTLEKTISYDTETALQEASRELEEKLRDLEANDLCKKNDGFYCDEDNSESSKHSIETVSILRELLKEAKEFTDNNEFKGYADDKYFIDNEQINYNNLKRKREPSESEDCENNSEPDNKKIMLQDNWAKCFEKIPVFGPYNIYQNKQEESDGKANYAAEVQAQITDIESPKQDDNCSISCTDNSAGPSCSYKKY